MAIPKVIFLMADYGHDPTETAVPFQAFVEAGFEVSIATENGKSPECDKKLLEGITQKLLGASKATIAAYQAMKAHPSMSNVLSWTSPSFSLDPYNLLFLPGGHEKTVRQVIDSPVVHEHILGYFPTTKRASQQPPQSPPPPGKHAVAAICHGVLVLADSVDPASGRSVLHGVTTTTLPAAFEDMAYWGTRPFLGDYYKTYGRGSPTCEEIVLNKVGDRRCYRSSLAGGGFVIEDENYYYLSGRFPGDTKLLAERAVKMVNENMKLS